LRFAPVNPCDDFAVGRTAAISVVALLAVLVAPDAAAARVATVPHDVWAQRYCTVVAAFADKQTEKARITEEQIQRASAAHGGTWSNASRSRPGVPWSRVFVAV